MTTVVIPDFIIHLFENEITGIITKVIDSISEVYDLSPKDLKALASKVIDSPLRIIPEEEEHIKIVRKNARRILEDDARCQGLIKKNGIICRCGFAHNKTSNYCTRHEKKANQDPTYFDTLKQTMTATDSSAEKKMKKNGKLY